MIDESETLKMTEMTEKRSEEQNPFFEEDEETPEIYEYEVGLEATHKTATSRNTQNTSLNPPLRYIDMSRCEEGQWGNVKPLFKLFNTTVILGPGWQPISPIVICTIILGCYFAIAYNLSLVDHPSFVGIIVAFGGLGLFAVVFFTAFTDPGFIKRKANQRIIKKHYDDIYCFRCMVSFAEAKKHGIMHCFDCDRCTKNHDHHCPVLGNCIAGNNIYTFYAMIAFFAFAVACAYLAMYYMIMADSGGDVRRAVNQFARGAGAPGNVVKKLVGVVAKNSGSGLENDN